MGCCALTRLRRVDAGDLNTAPALIDALQQRSTAPTGIADAGRVDIGYHYPW